MGSPIQTFIDDYNELHSFLFDNGKISESITISDHYRKILLLSCASYYEAKIIEIIKTFIENKASDDRITSFVTAKAIERQYHTYFDWDSSNINRFLSMFGSDFKEQVSAEIKANKKLEEQVKAFISIGAERNKMVHNNFLEYTLNKTFDEIIELYDKANLFISYLESKFE